MRTKEEIYEAISGWEMEAGESFLDYFDGSLKEGSLLFWALGKGYITNEQFQSWEIREGSYSNDEIIFGQEIFSVVQEPEFIFNDRENYEREYERAQRILAEFLSLTITYQNRLNKFLEENS